MRLTAAYGEKQTTVSHSEWRSLIGDETGIYVRSKQTLLERSHKKNLCEINLHLPDNGRKSICK